jgi:hypothetical protein
MQTTSSLTNRRSISATEVLKMKANQLGGPALEIARECMFGRERCATRARVRGDGVTNLCWQTANVLWVPAIFRWCTAAAGLRGSKLTSYQKCNAQGELQQGKHVNLHSAFPQVR